MHFKLLPVFRQIRTKLVENFTKSIATLYKKILCFCYELFCGLARKFASTHQTKNQ